MIRWKYQINVKNGHYSISFSIGNQTNWVEMNESELKVSISYIRCMKEPAISGFVNELSGWLSNKYKEPLYRNLIHEAFTNLNNNNNLRSALVIGVTSLEVGTKQVVMKLKPDCEWLLENTSSPPVEKMIDYVTAISDFTISKSDLDDIKNIVSIRNKMVHAGIFKLEYSKVNSYLVLIKMILITFDEYVI